MFPFVLVIGFLLIVFPVRGEPKDRGCEEELVLLSLQETPDLVPLEFHLAPPVITDSWTSGGVDVESTWQLPGGKGEGVTVVDFEKGWNLAHEDLPPGIELLSGIISSDLFSQDHGTKVLGVLGAVENDHGVTGMVPEATLKVAAPEPGKKLAPVLDSLVSQLNSGDVLLFEVGSSKCPLGLEEDYCQYGVPVETIASVFAVIQEATAKGVIVIEAAGNSALNLDNPAFVWKNEAGDSGAIMVGAGLPGSLFPTASSNFGSRVDVQGFGEGLVTTAATYGELGYPKGDVNNAYTESSQTSPNRFSDTSSAAVVVAGVVASLQGLAKANGVVLSPEQVRSILVQTGIKQGEPDSGKSEKHIGPLPNLGQALSMISDPPPPPPPPSPPPEEDPVPPVEVEDDDSDDDDIPNAQDNCPKTANPSQEDPNGNGKGYACDATENETLQWLLKLQKCQNLQTPCDLLPKKQYPTKEYIFHHPRTLWDNYRR